MIDPKKTRSRERLMRAIMLASALVIAGCASQPGATAPAPVTVTDHPQQTAAAGDLDEKWLARAIKRGYKVVNTNGEILYCRSDFATGSRIQTTTVCLTARQLDEKDQRTQRELATPNAPITVPGRMVP
jgi:hypothetical protein